MSWLDKGLSKLGLARINFIPSDANGNTIDIVGDSSCVMGWDDINTHIGQAIAYHTISPLQSIINKRSSLFQNGKVWVIDKDGNEPTTQEAERVRKLLKNPNPLQTWSEFYIQQKVYKYVFGYCPVYAVRGKLDNLPIALYNILPEIFNVETTGKLHKQIYIEDIIKSYYLKYGDEKIYLNINDVCILKDVTPCLETIKENSENEINILPHSRLIALRFEAAICEKLSEAKYVITAKRGALGILSNDATDAGGNTALPKDEKENLQKEFARSYGLSLAQAQVIITRANLKWQQMSLSVRELQLIELTEDAVKQMSDAYDCPYELLANITGVTYANKNEAKKSIYQDIVIPESKDDAEALTKLLMLDNLIINIDYYHVAIMQEDLQRRSTTITTIINGLNSATQSGLIDRFEARKELSKYIDIDPNI